MFGLSYVLKELRRRRARTLLTALGLGTGVAVVIAVTGLARGLDDAQDEVLEPLTGIGTDLIVSRPIELADEGAAGPAAFAGLSEEDREALQEENADAFVRPSELADPGESFSRTTFLPATQLTFPDANELAVSKVEGVDAVTGALSLQLTTVSGTLPETTPQGPGGPEGPRPGAFDLDLSQTSVTGVQTDADLGLITPDEVVVGRFLSPGADASSEVLLSDAYALREGIEVGDEASFGDESLEVVGLVKPPIGGQSSDAYVQLEALQEAAERKGRINLLLVRGTPGTDVAVLAKDVESVFPEAQVSDSRDLAETVSGSLVDASDLSDRLSLALAIVALGAAFALASLLTLSAVSKRTRELGTLRAIGWRRGRVVRQVMGESIATGTLGAAIGVGLGIAAAAIVSALTPDLEASAQSAVPNFGFGPRGEPPASEAENVATVALSASADVTIVLIGVGLALLGGIVAGAAGAVRASRLEPADAMRQVE